MPKDRIFNSADFSSRVFRIAAFRFKVWNANRKRDLSIEYKTFFTLQENSNYYFRSILHSLNFGKLYHFTINKDKLVQIGHSSD